jgi:hypothetical protein
MKQARANAGGRDALVIAGGVLLVLLAILVALEVYGPIPKPGPALDGKLAETQKNAIGLIVDLAKLFMTWSLAVIGGAGYFLKANIEKAYPLTRRDLLLAEAIILASVVSIFYGHLTINFVVTMLALDVLNLRDAALATYIRVQYVAFLVSLLLFGAYIHSTFFQRTTAAGAGTAETEAGGA